MTDQKYKDLMNGGWSYPKKESTDPEEVKKVVDKYLTDNKIDSETIDKKITDGVSKIVADAPEDFDTLKEMSDWISEHEDSAAAMNSAILDNKSGIKTLQKDKANATDVETLSSEVENNTNDISEIKTNLDVNVLIGKYPDTQTVQNVTFTKISDGKYTVVGTNSKTWGAQLRCKNFKALANVEYIVNVTGDSSLCYIGADTDISLGRKTNGSVLKFDSDTLVNIYIAAAGSATVDSTIEFSVITKNVGIEIDILTEDVSAINSSMSDYGLNNVFDGEFIQGSVNDDGSFNTDTLYLRSNKIACTSGDLINVYYGKTVWRIHFYFVNSSGEVVEHYTGNFNISKDSRTAPSNATGVYIVIHNASTTTPSQADKMTIYVNNQIDVVKNDVDAINSKLYTYKTWIGDGETVEVPCSDWSIVTVIGNNPAFYALCYVGNTDFVKPISNNDISVSNHVDGKVTITNSTGYGMQIAIKVERIV